LATALPLQIQASTESITTDQGVQPGPGIPPGECPEGFTRATPPLNPQLGCLPNTITSDPGVEPGPVIPPGGCPEGTSPPTPPLNPQLGCLPESETADPGVQHGEDETEEVPDDSVVDETADGDETTLSAVPAERQIISQQPIENGDGGDEGEDEGDEGEGNAENGNDRGGNEDVIQ
jgi:hypothetical protein